MFESQAGQGANSGYDGMPFNASDPSSTTEFLNAASYASSAGLILNSTVPTYLYTSLSTRHTLITALVPIHSPLICLPGTSLLGISYRVYFCRPRQFIFFVPAIQIETQIQPGLLYSSLGPRYFTTPRFTSQYSTVTKPPTPMIQLTRVGTRVPRPIANGDP